MGQALYRKYRSRSLGEIIGQEHITTTLKNALKAGKISHAYLFTGPRGVGKTSIARILAYEINGLPYTDDSQQHLDIIEIDAASNRRIDEIRELRDRIHIAPTSAKYKVYIIDEVHMLTKEAFNALLKTLEEPPEHVVFILATTEAHKLPETIISRTQRFTFKPIDNTSAVNHLRELAKKEGIKINDESLEMIAEHGGGSFRDSISLLDQISSFGTDIDADSVRRMIGVPSESAISDLLAFMRAGEPSEVMSGLGELYNQGFPAPQIAKRTARIISKGNETSNNDLTLLKQLIDVPASHDPKTYLELVFLEAALQNKPSSNVTNQIPEEQPAREVQKAEQQPVPVAISIQQPKKAIQKGDLWQKALDELKGKYNTLYGIARMAEASLNDDKLTLTFAFPFHQRRCNESRNRERIEEILLHLSGKQIELECMTGKVKSQKANSEPKHKPKEIKKSGTLDSITEVFGGGEILE